MTSSSSIELYDVIFDSYSAATYSILIVVVTYELRTLTNCKSSDFCMFRI